MKTTNAFFAYSSKPVEVSEIIEGSIAQINLYSSQMVKAIGWKSLNNTGKVLITSLLSAIDQSDLFVCDLTYLNPNVLFELGYAVAKGKRTWITLDGTRQKSRANYDKLQYFLAPLVYSPYSNTEDLVGKFFNEAPYENLGDTIYKSVIWPAIQSPIKSPSLFYLKCEINTEPSSRLARELKKVTQSIPVTIDDLDEVSTQYLAWYVQNTYYSLGVVAHLLDEERNESSEYLRNAVYSYVCGMAKAFSKPILLLAHDPFVPPVDYMDILRVHKTAADCVKFAQNWLQPLKLQYEEVRRAYQSRLISQQEIRNLHQIDLGDPVAENEQDNLLYYFIKTASFDAALKTRQYMLYIGRKGTGKSANLIRIADELRADKRNFVCVIRPIDIELEGLVSLLNSNANKANPGYLMQSLWKFLIYTELTFEVYNYIETLPMKTAEQEGFIRYVDENLEIINAEFAPRMETAINHLCQIQNANTIAEQRAKVSEILHSRLIGNLRGILGDVLKTKNRVSVLIDNLDKAWRQREDSDILAQFIFGLLSAGQAITDDFQKQKGLKSPVNLSLIIFLRSDIFFYIMNVAREADKINYTRIDWNDKRLLQRVIEERFANSIENLSSIEDVWIHFFCSHVRGEPTKEYIVNHIIPRPRDIIYFCRSALDHAKNHQNTKICEEDIARAEEEYSKQAYDSLVAELRPQIDNIELFFIALGGASDIISRTQIEEFISQSSISADQLNYVIELLCDTAFFGLETEANTFEFIYDYDQNKRRILSNSAKRTAQKIGEERFKINVPFHAYLDIKVV